jgi:hypothetical protein
VANIATLAFILFAIVLGFYNIFSSLLRRDIEIFLDFFNQSAHNKQRINPNTLAEINRLKKILKEHSILNIRGMGYMIDKP